MRRFNIAGACRPEYDYMIPPKRRMPQAMDLVDKQAYFTVHAPRQTGKTTIMRALAQRLTAAGRYAAPRQLTVFRSATSATANPLDLPKFHHAIEIAEGRFCQPEPVLRLEELNFLDIHKSVWTSYPPGEQCDGADIGTKCVIGIALCSSSCKLLLNLCIGPH